MAISDTPTFPWSTLDASQWLRSWQQVWRLAPESLVQPILPGWTFNINSNNSSAPQTEADVLARHSYGRQLGRIADALAALITEQHGNAPKAPAYRGFLDMKREIDEVKKAASAGRVERLVRDAQAVKEARGADYERLRAALRDLLRD